MTDVELVFVAGGVTGLVTAIPAVIGVLHQIRMDTKAQERADVAEKARLSLAADVKEIGVKTDGMKDALVLASEKVAHASGVHDEKARADAEKASNEAAIAKSKQV
jgi:hypothetical protein